MIESKACTYFKKIEEDLKLEEDEIAFLSTSRIGDNLFVLALANEVKRHHKVGKITVVLPPKFRTIAGLFNWVDRVVFYSDEILESICSSYCGFLIGMNYPRKGKLNIAHPATLEKIVGTNGFTFLDAVKLQLGLPLDSRFKKPRELPESVVEKILKKFGIDLSSAVLVSIENRAIRFDNNLRIKIVDTFVKNSTFKDYIIIFNEKIWYEYARAKKPSDRWKYLDMNLLEAFVVGKMSKGIISVRSGWTDLMAFTGNKVVALYPKRSSMFLGNPTRYIHYFPASKMFEGLNDNILDIELETFDERILLKILEFLNKR